MKGPIDPTAKLSRQETALLVVDVQERLFSAMEAGRRDAMVKNIKMLVAAAQRLGLPLLVSEQYPKGLGHTLPELKDVLAGVEPFEKVAFSCCAAEGFSHRLRDAGTKGLIVTGIETHVCVLLTALDLLATGYHVYVPADAVCSRARELRDRPRPTQGCGGRGHLGRDPALPALGAERHRGFSSPPGPDQVVRRGGGK